MSRATAALVALALAVSGLAAVRVPAQAAPGAPTITARPGAPIVGEKVKLASRLPTRLARPVVLQRRVDGRWRTVERSVSSPTGAVRFTRRAGSARELLRVSAPGRVIDGRRYPAVETKPLALTGTAQSVSFTATRDAGDSAGDVDVEVSVSHPRRGRTVLVQAGTPAGGWSTVAQARLGRRATTVLDDVTTVAQVTGRDLRVVLAARRGAASVASAVVSPPQVAVTASVTDGRVRASATTGGTVRAVRFFVDGVLAAEDTSPPWGGDWPAAAGDHDVVARAVGPLESVLSGSAVVTLSPSTISLDSGMAEGFELDVVQAGLDLPAGAAVLPTGAVLVTEKAGVVKVVEPLDGGGFAPPHEVLDLRSLVHDGGDSGLIGLAVDPAFAQNGYVYLSHVLEGGNGDRRSQQVVRYTWDGEHLEPGSRTVILGSVTGDACSAAGNLRTPDCLPLIGQSHTVGELAFDAAGRLLVGLGDGSLYATPGGFTDRYETLRAQDPEILAGKVLRVDPVTGRGVPDNPLYTGDGSSNASRVVALGLRNPFRFTVRDNLLLIGEVGEHVAEELDVLLLSEPQVVNYGWPCFEGTEETALGDVSQPDSPWHACAAVRVPGVARAPAYDYPHQSQGGSVTAGVFMDSADYPAPWRGRYVFGDYSQNRVWTAQVTPDGEVTEVETLADQQAAGGPVKFFTGPDGLVWMVSIVTGDLRRIRHTGAVAADRCPVGTFQRSFHDLDGPGSVFDQDFPDDEWAWLYPYAAVQVTTPPMAEPTCADDVRLAATTGSPWLATGETDERAHPGDRFGTVWAGRVDVAAGTYRFTVQGSEWVRLWVDGEVVHDFYSSDFWDLGTRQHDVVLTQGRHLVRAQLIHGDAETAAAEVTWTRVGLPPTISLDTPGNGHVVSGGQVPWSVTVSDPDGDPPAALGSTVQLSVDFLHYTGGALHAHPSQRITGVTSGIVTLDDVHAPGAGVVRLRATVTDASGARTTTPPVYVCFPGGEVGPCAP